VNDGVNQQHEEALRAVSVTKADLMRYHDPVRIQGYCASCEKHGAYWSCPPFAEPPLDSMPDWSHAVIVCQKTWIPAGSTKEQLMERFLEARLHFGKHMQTLERLHEELTALIAGHCSGCDSCTRCEGKPCRLPTRMRYSLEAVGFDVTALAEGLAGQKLHWPKSGLPEYLITVGAVLCPDANAAAMVLNAADSRPSGKIGLPV